jgi:hypothetical protein
MKLKYYLRGVGTGILFATVILSVSYHGTSKVKLSDAEIIKRAEALGMVKDSDINLEDLVAPTATPTVEPSVSPTASPTEQPTDQESTDQADTLTPTPETSKEPTSAPVDEPTNAPEESKTSSGSTKADNQSQSEDKVVSIEIVTGMTSEDVTKLLKEKGVIEDAGAFNQYLRQNDYTTEINIGNYEIGRFASYQDIADAIINK